MKKLLNSLYSTLFVFLHTFVIPTTGGISTAFAQTDSVRITHTQETGTLEKQRFIDKYDYVFMTKEPSKWILKGLLSSTNYPKTNNDLSLNGIGAGFEYKLTPSWSVGSNIFFQGLRKNYGIDYTAEGYTRWYYDMNQRIREGKSANNFSGNYLGLQFNHFRSSPIFAEKGDYIPRSRTNTLGLHWGMQRRFFNHGLLDFSLSLSRYDSRYISPSSDGTTAQVRNSGFVISTNWRVGLALGDFKNQRQSENLCEVFRCLEEENSLLKIALPSLNLNLNDQQLAGSIAYERKLGKSPFSLNIEYQTNFLSNSKVYSNGNWVSDFHYSWSNWVSLDTRYYLFQKAQINKGKAARNLSGFYAGLQVGAGHTSNNYKSSLIQSGESTYWTAPIVGFQQKIFKNGFIDFRVGLPVSPLSKPTTQGSGSIKPKVSDFKIGFSF